MKAHFRKCTRFILVITAIAVLALDFFNLDSVIRTTGVTPAQAAAPDAEYRLFLPLTENFAENAPSVNSFGADLETSMAYFPALAQTSASWVRGKVIFWNQIEPQRGQIQWALLSEIEQQLIQFQEAGMQTVLQIHGAPEWAQKVAGYSCGPVKKEAFADLAAFARQLVVHFSAEPYNVEYFELWNEPDIAYWMVAPDSGYGCWGDDNDPYYGGGYYADMLSVVYPAMKAANPAIKVVSGGLMLGCDPNIASHCGDSANRARFFEGILRHNGRYDGAQYFDVVNFHAYDYYTGKYGEYTNMGWGEGSQEYGPSLRYKANYLRSLLADPRFNAGEKEIINSEVALLCKGGYTPGAYCDRESNSPFELTKANFLVQVYASSIAANVKVSIWYGMRGWWNNSGLITGTQGYRPAYYAFLTAAEILSQAVYVQDIVPEPGVFGYEFLRYGQKLFVLWATDGEKHEIGMPDLPTRVIDLFGKENEPSVMVEVGVEPIYIFLP